MKNSILIISALFISSVFFISTSYAVEVQVIAGAGPSTAVVQLFAKTISSQPQVKKYSLRVPPKSAKHAGGIKGSNRFVFGRTGRPLNSKEKAMGKSEIFLGRVPVAIAVGSKVSVSTITLSQLKGIYTGSIINWKQVGGSNNQISIIGREAKEALFSVLKQEYPFFKKSKFKFVVKKDNHVIALLRRTQGEYGIGFGAKPNFAKSSIPTLRVEGFSTGVSIGLVYDNKNKNHELVKAAKAFVKSKKWAKAVQTIGMMPPK